MKIDINKIKKLRDITNISIIECKKALIITKGNINEALDHIRKYSKIESIKKSKNKTKEGLILDYVTKDFGILLEINCQTDFVAKSIQIINFGKKILTYVFKYKQENISIIRKVFNQERIKLIGILKENIYIHRIGYIKGEFIGKYIHHSKRIGVIIKSNINNNLLMKQISMHIVMLKPNYICEKNIPKNIINHEYDLQKSIAIKNNKSKIIIKKIIEGRVKKFINNITLYNQKFLFNNKRTVFDVLSENNMKISEFICFELGSKYN
ncbi:translation elongation factor Ts [Enterobacteriaceae endosymbiont of Donacia bicoloricornis]|uniref:translation elongation factor Ts n=1 Tax=Enterobacteriaceae endosymbiont of Donacia bicoloricornis TaxID=2675772 RepID=UPI0014497CDC|nr:translation elongation factor Ts [Enterobacteriaceae endosymbiont of Donacia bicoloricornis]QJC37753.1 translation elongation factor Ts [Enterobacteriaceae endosymbiont of Donacia bicoloricornis]